jgi:hypothetical protein
MEVGLSLGEPESLIRLSFKSCLCVKVLRALFGKSDSFLCVVPSVHV